MLIFTTDNTRRDRVLDSRDATPQVNLCGRLDQPRPVARNARRQAR
jgi:hypothetical protein